LISLDSDERIQGNPRKSNPHKQVFSQPNGEVPRKSKLIDAFRQRLLRPVRQSRYRLLAANPDVVLRVAGGIVRIAAGIVRAAVRRSGGIDRLIGVAAGEHERHKSQKDRDPHFASSSSMEAGAQASVAQSAISFKCSGRRASADIPACRATAGRPFC
jgi:hypothetical protein